MTASRCRCCGHVELIDQLDVRDVPVENSRLPFTAQEARSVARGDLLLRECRRCGFIQNDAFDPALVVYDAEYLADQSGSPFFRAFADRIVDELLGRVEQPQPTALEIGCGEGAFLERFCAASGGAGIGVDPVAPDRSDGELRFVPAEFGAGSGDFDADVVICRHTLEHIAEVATFLRTLRSELESRPDCLVYLEVPDTGRILREGAFWDLYYEHCSYFDEASLRYLLASTGFEVVECRLDYADQYLVAFARLGEPTEPPNGRDCSRSFAPVTEGLEEWRAWAEDRADAGSRVAVWAASSKAVSFLSMIDDANVVVATDINPDKAGRFLPGSATEVCAPDQLADHEVDTVVVMNPVYLEEVRSSLSQLGLVVDTIGLGS